LVSGFNEPTPIVVRWLLHYSARKSISESPNHSHRTHG